MRAAPCSRLAEIFAIPLGVVVSLGLIDALRRLPGPRLALALPLRETGHADGAALLVVVCAPAVVFGLITALAPARRPSVPGALLRSAGVLRMRARAAGDLAPARAPGQRSASTGTRPPAPPPPPSARSGRSPAPRPPASRPPPIGGGGAAWRSVRSAAHRLRLPWRRSDHEHARRGSPSAAPPGTDPRARAPVEPRPLRARRRRGGVRMRPGARRRERRRGDGRRRRARGAGRPARARSPPGVARDGGARARVARPRRRRHRARRPRGRLPARGDAGAGAGVPRQRRPGHAAADPARGGAARHRPGRRPGAGGR